MFEELFTTSNLIAFLTLTALEIVLGVDNVVFLAILVDRLPRAQQALARRLGLMGAAVMRILLLLVIDWIADLTEPFYELDIFGWQHPVSWRDVILILGGLVLIAKATLEIGHMVGDAAEHDEPGLARKAVSSFSVVIAQVMAMDLVFSLDSVITAVGMADHLWVMVAAVLVSVAVMLLFAAPVSRFVEQRPTVKMLALAFLVLIGFTLVMDGTGVHVAKGYIYFAMGFALAVEGLNLWRRARKYRSRPTAPHTD